MPKKVTIYQLTTDGGSQAFEVWDHVAEEALAAHPNEYAMQPWPALEAADTKKAEETDKPKKRASKKDVDVDAAGGAQEAGAGDVPKSDKSSAAAIDA